MRPASLLLIALLSFALLPSGLIERAPAQEPPAPGGRDAAPLDDLEQTWHALNRLAFGPRPGDVERVAAMGWRTWFEEQLDPSSIEDPAIDTLLAARFYPQVKLGVLVSVTMVICYMVTMLLFPAGLRLIYERRR